MNLEPGCEHKFEPRYDEAKYEKDWTTVGQWKKIWICDVCVKCGVRVSRYSDSGKAKTEG